MNRRSFLSLFAALPVVGKYWKPKTSKWDEYMRTEGYKFYDAPDCIACHEKYAVHGPAGRGLCNDCHDVIKRGIAYTPKMWGIDEWLQR